MTTTNLFDIAFLLIGVCLWWTIYGVECFLNGAMGDWTMPFREWWKQLRWNVPFVGWSYRLEQTRGDIEWAKELPGPIHFGCMCVLLPLLPWIGYRAALLMFD